ncbi:uncharacterized protein [Asterias amurensis]|uniref:uncharacterized protein n=1 Tax=Asterias amurensis TaxID=7602 RepID=UPI003AB43F9D
MASNIVQSVPCPACFIKDPVVEHLDPLDTQDLSVTLHSSGETISFKDATKTYLQDHYPNLSCATYRVPAAHFYHNKGDLDLKTNDEVSEKEVAHRFQKDAVEKVVKCFYSWGCEHREGMFVLSEYNMQNYLRAVKTGSKKRKTIDGDHDVMVIHLNTGVTFVQVKSVKTTSACKTMRRQTQSAFEQVAKDEKAFREMNADLDFISTVPVVGFVALPNLTRDHLSKMGMCDAHKRQVLTSEDLESPTEFNESVGKRFRAGESLGLGNYKDVCGRYVGLASVVRIRTLPDAIKKTSAKVGKILLTPEQNEIIRVGNQRQVIFGDYGTGKSLILAKQAEKIVTSEDGLQGIVFVVSCTSMNLSSNDGLGRLLRSPSHLVSQFRNLFSEPMSPSIKIMSIADLVLYCFPDTDPYSVCFSPALMAKLTRGVLSKHPKAHIMWDEVPFVLSLDWIPFKDLCEQYPCTFFWISISLEGYLATNATGSVDPVENALTPYFNISWLTRCMRMTRNGFRFYQALKPGHIDKRTFQTASGNAVDGCAPRWYPLQKCSCGIADPLSCTCIQPRFTHTLKYIWGLLKNIDPASVSFVLGDTDFDINHFLMNVVRKACKTLQIPVDASPTSDDDNNSAQEMSEVVASGSKCRIVDSVSYRGCESPVVVIVIEDESILSMVPAYGRNVIQKYLPAVISRALGQIFIITFQRYEIGSDDDPDLVGFTIDWDSFLDILAAKNVILECQVPADSSTKYTCQT